MSVEAISARPPRFFRSVGSTVDSARGPSTSTREGKAMTRAKSRQLSGGRSSKKAKRRAASSYRQIERETVGVFCGGLASLVKLSDSRGVARHGAVVSLRAVNHRRIVRAFCPDR